MRLLNFYEINNSFEIMKFACKLLKKLYESNIKVIVITQNGEDVIVLDKLLWTFSKTDFISHDIDENKIHDTPIYITNHLQKPVDLFDATVLINTVPDNSLLNSNRTYFLFDINNGKIYKKVQKFYMDLKNTLEIDIKYYVQCENTWQLKN